MNTKILIVASVAICSSMLAGNVVSGNQAREQICLSIASYAGSAAQAREDGMGEQETLSTLTPGKKGTPAGDLHSALKQVVTWIHTVQPSPSDARKLVYLKCLDREFYAYNKKLDG